MTILARKSRKLESWLLMVSLIGCVSSAVGAGLKPSRLTELENKKLAPTAKARLGLRLYRDEMVKPTPPPKPPYTDPKTHDWVLAQITRKLTHVGADVKTLRQAYDGANPGEVKDSLMLFLALKGEKDVLPTLTPFVLDRRKPLRLRELGVQALGRLGVKTDDAKIGDTLAQVLREDSAGVYRSAGSGAGGQGAGGRTPKGKAVSTRNAKPGTRNSVPPTRNSELGTGNSGAPALVIEYPIRKAAAQAIKVMDKAGILLPSYVTQAVERAQLEMKLPARKPAAGVPAPATAPTAAPPAEGEK